MVKLSVTRFMKLSLYVAILFNSVIAWAQKPVIDTNAIKNWRFVGNSVLSPKEKYHLHGLRDLEWKFYAFTIAEIKGQFKRVINTNEQPQFTADDAKVLYKMGDTLVTETLGKRITQKIAGVSSFKLLHFSDGDRLIYQLNDSLKTLVLKKVSSSDLMKITGAESFSLVGDNRLLGIKLEGGSFKIADLQKLEMIGSFDNIQDAYFNEKGTAVVLDKKTPGHPDWSELSYLDLFSKKNVPVWRGSKINSLVFNHSGNDFAFLASGENGKPDLQCWNQKQQRLKKIYTGDSYAGTLSALSGFSSQNDRVDCIISFQPTIRNYEKILSTKVDVWSYRDRVLQSAQSVTDETHEYKGAVEVNSGKFIQYERLGDQYFTVLNDSLAYIENVGTGDMEEQYWTGLPVASPFLMDLKNGDRRPLPFQHVFGSSLSVGGKYLLLTDNNDGGTIYSYEISTGKKANLTAALPAKLGDAGGDSPGSVNVRGLRFEAWLPQGNSLLMFDRYDLWKVDPSGLSDPVCLTNGFGRKHQLIFRLIESNKLAKYTIKNDLILKCFNEINKQAGFYKINLSVRKDPVKLSMGAYAYPGFEPRYSGRNKLWFIQRGSASSSYNIYQTSDFINFKVLSDVHPEKAYNWLSSELITFPTLDGRQEYGILYKPENFDPSKRYPVIFFYYEKVSHRTNEFIAPELSSAMDVSWFTSRGYLVFRPDVHYKIGSPFESAFSSVVGAARHLMKLPYVDGQRLGLNGHSWGAFQTNYIVSHTDLFAAAYSGAGTANLISNYGRLGNSRVGEKPTLGRASQQYWAEQHQIRIGASLWENPSAFIKQSSILNADKVSTPMLLMHNEDDSAVPFGEGLEWFLGLRRLGKRAWLLQYDGSDHTISEGDQLKDFTYRLLQFYDHYLKGESAPIWMTRGISKREKFFNDGFGYDHEMKTPGPGLNSAADQKKIDGYSRITLEDKLRLNR